METIQKKFGYCRMMQQNHIKTIRKDRGLSQEDLANAVGSSNQMISNLERGAVKLTLDWMNRIAEALDCYPQDLIDGGPAKSPDEQLVVSTFRGMDDPGRAAAIEALRTPITTDLVDLVVGGVLRILGEQGAIRGPDGNALSHRQTEIIAANVAAQCERLALMAQSERQSAVEAATRESLAPLLGIWQRRGC